MVYTIDFLREVQNFINGYSELPVAKVTPLVREKFDIDMSVDEVRTLCYQEIPSSVEELLERLKLGIEGRELKMLELISEELPPLYECEECGRYYSHQDSMIFDNSGDCMCQDCFESSFYICVECDNFVYHTDAFWDDDNTPYCEECYHEHLSIHEYGYKPYPIFHGESNRFLGVELEVDRGGQSQSVAGEVISILGYDFVYCKYDGSLDDGFEIVSHPATLEFHSQVDWGEVLDYLRHEGYESHDAGTCGLHVHMNRDGFGETEEEQELGIAKILFFFERHWDKVVKFSRRTPSQLDEWAARYLCSSPEHPEDVLEYAKDDMSRYRAVNLCNHSTIEIRVFRGSLIYETFMAALQFCDLLYDIAAMPLEAVMEITWNEFKEMGSKYKEFGNYLERRGL